MNQDIATSSKTCRNDKSDRQMKRLFPVLRIHILIYIVVVSALKCLYAHLLNVRTIILKTVTQDTKEVPLHVDTAEKVILTPV